MFEPDIFAHFSDLIELGDCNNSTERRGLVD